MGLNLISRGLAPLCAGLGARTWQLLSLSQARAQEPVVAQGSRRETGVLGAGPASPLQGHSPAGPDRLVGDLLRCNFIINL